MIVISCFDHSTNMVKPWANAGYKCYCVDIQHPKGEKVDKDNPNIIRVGADLLDWVPPRGEIAFASFFPPCTDLAVSGARWFSGKGLDALWKAIRLFSVSTKLAEWSGAPYMIENPASTISSYWRNPDYTFHPWEYGGYLATPGDAYTKKTCLWVGGRFIMPEKRRVTPLEGSKMQLLPPSEDRANLRSETPMGFAKAVFQANHADLLKRAG